MVHNLQPSTQYSFVEATCTRTAGCQTGGVTNVTTLDSGIYTLCMYTLCMWTVCLCVCVCCVCVVCVVLCVVLCVVCCVCVVCVVLCVVCVCVVCVHACVCVCACAHVYVCVGVCIYMYVCGCCLCCRYMYMCMIWCCRYMFYGLLFLPCVKKMACTLSRHKQHLHACVPCAHDVCVGYVLCVQLYSTKPEVVIDNHFVSFSHP